MVAIIIAPIALIVLIAVIFLLAVYGKFGSVKLSATLAKWFSVNIELENPQRSRRERDEKDGRSIPPV